MAISKAPLVAGALSFLTVEPFLGLKTFLFSEFLLQNLVKFNLPIGVKVIGGRIAPILGN